MQKVRTASRNPSQLMRQHGGLDNVGRRSFLEVTNGGDRANTVVRFERGEDLKQSTIDQLRAVLEAAGVEVIAENGGGPGVRLAKRALVTPIGTLLRIVQIQIHRRELLTFSSWMPQVILRITRDWHDEALALASGSSSAKGTVKSCHIQAAARARQSLS